MRLVSLVRGDTKGVKEFMKGPEVDEGREGSGGDTDASCPEFFKIPAPRGSGELVVVVVVVVAIAVKVVEGEVLVGGEGEEGGNRASSPKEASALACH